MLNNGDEFVGEVCNLDLSLNLTVVYLIEMTIRNVHLLIHELNVNVLKIDIVIP